MDEKNINKQIHVKCAVWNFNGIYLVINVGLMGHNLILKLIRFDFWSLN